MKMLRLVAVALSLGALGAAGQAVAADRPEVTPYGFVLVNVQYNLNDANPVDIPVTAGPDDEKSFLITPRQSRFGLKMSGTEAHGAAVTGRLELDFFGLAGSGGAAGVTQTAPRLRLASIRLNWDSTSLLIGQDWILFAPLAPSSIAHVSIAGLTGSGNLWARLPQIALEKRMDKIKINVGLTRPFAADGATAGQNDAGAAGETKGLPFLQARLGVSPSESLTVGGNLHFGQLEVADDNDKTFAVAVDAELQMGAIGVKAEGFSGEATNMLFSRAGRGQTTVGGWGQISYKMGKSTVNAGYGMESLDEDELADGDLSKNQTVFGNVITACAESVKIALEVGNITTSYKAGEDQSNVRINLAMQYLF